MLWGCPIFIGFFRKDIFLGFGVWDFHSGVGLFPVYVLMIHYIVEPPVFLFFQKLLTRKEGGVQWSKFR